MNEDLFSLFKSLDIYALFEVMADLVDNDIAVADIVDFIKAGQIAFMAQITKCITLAGTDQKYQNMGPIWANVKQEIDYTFALLNSVVQTFMESDIKASKRHFNMMMNSIKQDIFLETMSGEVPETLFRDGRYLQIFRQSFGRKFYRVRRMDNGNWDVNQPDELFHLPNHLQSQASRGRYSCPDIPSLYLTTNIDLGVNECGNPSKYAFSEFQSNYLGYSFSKFNDSLEVIILAIYHPLAVCCWSKINEGHSSEYWISILIRYLKTFPLILACSMKKSDKRSIEQAYIVPQLLMQWVVENKDFCDGILYFSKSADIKKIIDVYEYNIALPAIPPFDEKGHSVNLKKLLRWSTPKLKQDNTEIISVLTITTQNDKNREFIRLCTWLQDHHVTFSELFDKDIKGVKIMLRQWSGVIDIRDTSCIKFVLHEFEPKTLAKKLEAYGIL